MPKYIILLPVLFTILTSQVRAADFDEDQIPDNWAITNGFSTNGVVGGVAPIGWWQFNNTNSLNVPSRTSTFLTGSLSNFIGNPFTAGILSNALSFSSNAYVNVTSNSVLNLSTGFTASAWVKIPSNANQQATIFNWTGTNSMGFSLGVSTNGFGQLVFNGTNGTVQVVIGASSPLFLRDNKWHALAATYQSQNSNALLYVDGNLEASKAIKSWSFSPNQSLFFGSPRGTFNNPSFIMDEVRLYPGQLTANGILQLPITFSDFDGDGLTVLDEYTRGLSPNSTDYPLTLAINGGGTISGATNGAYYPLNKALSLKANPAVGYVFNQWSGDLSGTNNPSTIVMSGARSVTANFIFDTIAPTITITSPVPGVNSQTYTTPDLTSPSGISSVSTPGVWNPNASCLFDNDPRSLSSTAWLCTVTDPQSISYQFPSNTVINGYSVCSSEPGYTVNSWTFEGSTNGTSWVVLDSHSNFKYLWPEKTFDITNNTAYAQYRWDFNAPIGYYTLTEIDLKEQNADGSYGPDLTSSAGNIQGTTGDPSYASITNVFDNDSNWNTSSMYIVYASSGYLQYNFGSGNAKKIRRYKINAGYSSEAPTSWTFKGSNDGTNWTVLDTQTYTNWGKQSFSFNNSTAYQSYRLNMSSGDYAGYSVSEMELYATLKAGPYTPDLTSPSGNITASAETYPASHAFDDDTTSSQSTIWLVSGTVSGDQWLKYDFGIGQEKAIASYRIFPGNPAYLMEPPKSWRFEASNDNTNWTVLDSQSNIVAGVQWISDTWKTFNFANQKKYQFYRIYITERQVPDSGSVQALNINEMEMMEAVDPVYNTTLGSVSLAGKASDNGAFSVSWTNLTSGTHGAASGTTNWNANSLPLVTGLNDFQVIATDGAGNRGTDRLKVFTTRAGVIGVNPSGNTTFTNTVIGMSQLKNFVITNTGIASFSGTVKVSKPFSFPTASDTNYTIPPNGFKTVAIQYAPTVEGTFTNTVTFTGGGGTTRKVIGSTINDYNSDGIPDSWEFSKFGANYFLGGIYGPGGDPDGDGLTNAQEYAQGNNPNVKEFKFSLNIVGGGTVTGATDGKYYATNSTLKLTAKPNVNYGFAGWTGDLTGRTNPKSITMNSAKSVTATFVFDDINPVINITRPVSGGTPGFSTNVPSISVGGNVFDAGIISTAKWFNDSLGTNGTISNITGKLPSTNQWTVSQIPLIPGLNKLRVSVVDWAGHTGTNQLDVQAIPNYKFLLSWGVGGSGDGQFNQPMGFDISKDNKVYVSDRFNSRIQIFDLVGNFLSTWGSGFSVNAHVALDDLGHIFVADAANNRVVKLTTEGAFISQVGSGSPFGVAYDKKSGFVYVIDTNDQLTKYDANFNIIKQWGSSGSGNGQFSQAFSVAVDASGFVYVADRLNNRIQKFDSQGNFIRAWGEAGSGPGQLGQPRGIRISPDGMVYVADTFNHRVQVFTKDGEYITQWGSLGSGPGQFTFPQDVAFDAFGNVYVMDTNNNRVQKFSIW